jgi:hypothetical protein
MDSDPYSELFIDRPSKVLALIYSTVTTLVFTPLLYSIVRFEKNRHHRTLIKQLMASTVWTAIIWNLIVQPLAIYRFVFGPVRIEAIVLINAIGRNGLPMQGLLLLDAILVVKYAFLFHTKNPTAIQDDFWNMFLNIWTFAFTSISQIIYIVLQGQNSLNFFIYNGECPVNTFLSPKMNYPVIMVVAVSTLIYLFVGMRHMHFKYCAKSSKAAKTGSVGISISNFPLNSQTLVSFTTHGVMIFLLSSNFLVLIKVNKMSIEILSRFPNYFLFYTLQLILPCSTVAATVIVYFIKSKTLYNQVRMDCIEILKSINHKWTI